MHTAPLLLSVALIGFLGLSSGPSIDTVTLETEPVVRIGVYDNRAVAIAFGQSRFNPVHEKREARQRAAEAGDEATIAELNAWGESFQRRLHFQGFGRYPVDDLLAHVQDDLPALADRLDLDAIAWFCDYYDPGVEVIDVTAELVSLFDPNEQAIEWISQIGDADIVDLDTLIDLDPHE